MRAFVSLLLDELRIFASYMPLADRFINVTQCVF